MGACWSDRFNSLNPHTGLTNCNSKRGDGEHSHISTSKVSSASIPATPRSEDEILQCSNLKIFTFNELRTATRNFRPDSVVGEGGFGSVFKGWIDEHSLTPTKPGTGLVIAVKRLNREGLQGHREWLAEINYLGQLSHPNLVKLIGYCFEDDHRLLVYEFMQKGSAENHLFRRSSHFRPLSWNVRTKIALDAARGLAFLHNSDMKVIYRDFKTSNILLDANYDAKLSDFGLARDGPVGDKSHVSTKVMGTHGYAAPEYLATGSNSLFLLTLSCYFIILITSFLWKGHLTAKSDVYSFGVVLLELLSGRRAIDKNRPSGEHNLVDWAKPHLISKRKIFRVMDNRLSGQYDLGQAQKAANLAFLCLATEPKYRPTMNEVVTALEQLQKPSGILSSGREHHNSRPSKT